MPMVANWPLVVLGIAVVAAAAFAFVFITTQD